MVTSSWGIAARTFPIIPRIHRARFNLKTVSAGIEIPYSDKIFFYTKTVCRSLSKYMSNFDKFSVFLSFQGTL